MSTSCGRAPRHRRAANPPRLLRLGKVKAPHGLRGELKIKCDNPHTSAPSFLRRLFLPCGDQTREFRLLKTRQLGRGQFKVRLEGLNDIGDVQAMRGCDVMAALDDLPPTGPREFYYFEAVGCQVRSVDRVELGRITQSFFTGAHDVWVVENEGVEFMLPVVDEVVKETDFKRRVVTVKPIPGLLD